MQTIEPLIFGLLSLLVAIGLVYVPAAPAGRNDPKRDRALIEFQPYRPYLAVLFFSLAALCFALWLDFI